MPEINIDTITTVVTYLLVFLVAGSIHEFAHASASYALGDPTAKHSGRMTINPMAHIDPIGSILFPIVGVGIGWMKPVPVFLPNLRNPIRDDAIISLAGPFSNFIQACLAILVMKVIYLTLGNQQELFYILNIYAYINIILMGFNLLPIPPLDGGAILKYFLPVSTHHIFNFLSRFGFIILILLLASGSLRVLLVPFTGLVHFLVNIDIVFLVLINLANIAIVAYFFKDLIRNKSFLNKKVKKGARPIMTKSIGENKSNLNARYIKQAENIIKIDKEKGSLDTKTKEEINKLKQSIDTKANICPPSDYDTRDETCKNCEWFKNCLVRYTENTF